MSIFFGSVLLGVLLSVPFGKSDLFDGLFNMGSKKETMVDEWKDNVDVIDVDDLHWGYNAKWPGEISFYNGTTKTGIVADSDKGSVALEGFNGDKAIIDMNHESAFFGSSRAKTDKEFELNLMQYDIENEKKGTPEYPMEQVDRDPTKKRGGILMELLSNICPSFVELALQIKELIQQFIPNSLLEVIKIIKMMFAPIVWVLAKFAGIILAPVKSVWNVFKFGVRAFINIFKWLFKLFTAMPRAIIQLIKSGAKFAINAVVGALNGALALCELLKAIGEKINLMSIWKGILCIPQMLCKLINGLGGMVMSGVTGLFGLLSKIFQCVFGGLMDILKKFVGNILDCIRGGRPTDHDLNEAYDQLENVARSQTSKYHTHREFRIFNNFIQSLKGKGNFQVKGLPISNMIGIIKETSAKAKDTVLKLMNCLNPFAPMKSIMARLFVDTIVSLNTTKGPSYVNQLFPNIEIPEAALKGTNRNLAVDLILPDNIDLSVMDLSTTEMLRSMPIIKDIYREFDEAAQEYTNSTLEFLLTNQYVEELVEFTTTLVGLRK